MLIVLIEGWIDEVTRYVALLVLIRHTQMGRHMIPGALSYSKFHGKNRKEGYSHLRNDIVFTTYGTIAAEFAKVGSLLHTVYWYRVVLDEG